MPQASAGPSTRRCMKAAAAIALACSLGTSTAAQGRTDIVTLANGDRITGEVVRLERGRLEFKTDDAGTLYLEWDKLSSAVTARRLEVLAADGRRFVGSLGAAADRSISVVTSEGKASLRMSEVTLITPIGARFWRQLTGSIDAGFSYTRSSGVAQLNVNSNTVYRKLASQARLTGALTQTEKNDDSGDDDRGFVEMSYLRYPWQRGFVLTAGRFETNQSLGLTLRSLAGAAAGPRLVNSNRAQLVVGAGLALNDERGVDVEPTQNVEAFFTFEGAFYTYDRPKTNVDISVRYFPSLSDMGRQRVQLDAGGKRELWRDLFVALNLYNTYDSRPPNPEANSNDVGIVLSIGWTY